MKYRTILMGICLSSFITAYSQVTPEWQWAQRAGGTGGPGGVIDDKATGIAVDNEGNTYVAGRIYQSGFATFDTLPVITYGESDLFIASYDCDGKLRWVKTGGSKLHEVDAAFIQIDTMRRKVYFISTFASFTLASFKFANDTTIIQNHRSIFVWQFEYDGTLNWMFNSENGGGLQSSDIDVMGNIHILIGLDTGLFAPGYSIQNRGIYHAIIDTVGIVKDLIVVSASDAGPNSKIAIYDMSIDSQLNAYYTGNVQDSGFIDGQKIIPTGIIDGIIIKHDALGNVEWYKQIPAQPNQGVGFVNIAVKDEDNFYVTGGGSGMVTIGSLSFNIGVTSEGLIIQYKNGLSVWGKHLTSSHTAGNGLRHLAIDATHNVYVVGSFLRSATLDGITVTDIGTGPNYEAFIAKFDSSNTIQYAVPLPGLGNDFINAITVGHNGNVFIAGAFGFDLQLPNDTILTNTGVSDIFTAKFGIPECSDTTSPIGIVEQTENGRLELFLYPNPTTGRFTVEVADLKENGTVSVYNALGQLIFSSVVKASAGSARQVIEIDGKPGMYLVRLDVGKDSYYRKLILKR